MTTVAGGRRITNLDLVRGVAVLGVLVMNAVSDALPMPAYFNLRAGGTETWLDWAIGAERSAVPRSPSGTI